MLSLTRPELPIIISVLLKSEGFYSYANLSEKINDVFYRVGDMLDLNDRDDSYTITVRDIFKLTRAANSLLDS